MKVLVVGGAGFLGTYVVRALAAAGHTTLVLDREPDRPLFAQLVQNDPSVPDPALIRCDANDLDQVVEIAEAHSIDAFVHLAGSLTPECSASPMQGLVDNVVSTASVFAAAERLGIDRTVWAGSTSSFRAHHQSAALAGRTSESTPASFYSLYKGIVELQALRYAAEKAVPSVGLRLALGYGFGRVGGRGAWVRDLMEGPLLSSRVVIHGGDCLVPFLYIEDAAGCIVAAVESEPSGARIFDVTSDIRRKSEAIEVVRGAAPGVEILLEDGNDAFPIELDFTRVQEDLRWEPRFPIERGIVVTMDRYRTALDQDAARDEVSV